MTQNIDCITLRIVKYSDSISIATLWSRQLGRISASVPAGNGREARRRRAIMQPFSAFEAVARSKPGQEIAHLSDVRSITALADANPVKSIMGLFLADFLYVVLKESAADETLSQFLFDSVDFFAHSTPAEMANFHLMFLYRLGFFLGIQPDMGTYHPGRVFDMREARFVASKPLHHQVLTPQEAAMAHTLSRLNHRNLHLLKLNRQQRNQMLDHILEYYTLHYAPVGSLSSLSVVRDVFG